MSLDSLDNIMANCTKCRADITATGYEAEELKLPNDVTGYLVLCGYILIVCLNTIFHIKILGFNNIRHLRRKVLDSARLDMEPLIR
jgi:hypothetical protein